MTTKLKLSKHNVTVDIGLRFTIAYRNNGNVIIEIINANSHSDAVRIASQRGKVVSVIYLEKPTDLIYCH